MNPLTSCLNFATRWKAWIKSYSINVYNASDVMTISTDLSIDIVITCTLSLILNIDSKMIHQPLCFVLV